MFEIPIQAAIGKGHRARDSQSHAQGRIGECYGGDISRKRAAGKAEGGKKRCVSWAMCGCRAKRSWPC
ncbi:MAG: hypothetical protein ACLTBF_03330 [Christensenellales bacterium]